MSKTAKEIISEDVLTCNICFEEFQDPKILPCLHSFCEECILTSLKRQQRTGQAELTCPTCRARVDTDENGDINLQTNYPVKNLLEMIKDLPNNEAYSALYKVKADLTLNLAHIMSISESGQCVYLQASVDELRFCVIELRKQIIKHKEDLEKERAFSARLSKDLVNSNRQQNQLMKEKESLEKIIQAMKKQKPASVVPVKKHKPSSIVQTVYWLAEYVAEFGRKLFRKLKLQ